MSYYPVYLNLRNQPCFVIGGGDMAEAKTQGLLEAGARVTVIAPALSSGLAAMHRNGDIDWVDRDFQPGDLTGGFLAVNTLNDPLINEAVWREATAHRVLLNTVDDAPHCHFIAPSVVRRGDLALAISTSGKAPALAVRLRQRLEGMIGQEYARFLELTGDLRETLTQRHPDFETRRALWYRLVDSDVLDLLRRGEDEQARERIREILDLSAPTNESILESVEETA